MHLGSEILNNLLVLAVNFSDFRYSPIDWMLQPYMHYIGNVLYPVLGSAIVGLIFAVSKKYIGALAGIFVVWATFSFSDTFMDASPIISMFISILASLLVVGLIMLVFMRPEKDIGG